MYTNVFDVGKNEFFNVELSKKATTIAGNNTNVYNNNLLTFMASYLSANVLPYINKHKYPKYFSISE